MVTKTLRLADRLGSMRRAGPGASAISPGRRRCICSAVILASVGMGCGEPLSPVLTRLMDARRLAAELQVAFSHSADAANRAVIADTDEASTAFAHEAQEQAQQVQRDLDQVDGIGGVSAIRMRASCSRAFAKHSRIQRARPRDLGAGSREYQPQGAAPVVRGCTHGGERAARLLSDAAARVAAKDQWHASALAAKATLAVREIEVLQAPHIAASEDAVMTQLESQMAALEATARSALQELSSLGGTPELHAAADAASKSLTDFTAINAQLVALSRRNSNVRSLALSLGQKLTLTALCEGSLRALNDRLSKRDLPRRANPTRRTIVGAHRRQAGRGSHRPMGPESRGWLATASARTAAERATRCSRALASCLRNFERHERERIGATMQEVLEIEPKNNALRAI